jgi:hypothetical protein
MGGLFIETDTPPVAGMSAELDFLVQEGQIRAEAVVRHAEPGRVQLIPRTLFGYLAHSNAV